MLSEEACKFIELDADGDLLREIWFKTLNTHENLPQNMSVQEYI